jgi:hypothetical protein
MHVGRVHRKVGVKDVQDGGYFVAIINTCHDELFCNFHFIDGVVSEQSANRIADGWVQAVLGAMHGESDCRGMPRARIAPKLW